MSLAAGGSLALPPSLNELQALLHGAGRARGRAVEAFRVLGELAERMRIELLALADLQATSAPALRTPLQALRASATQVLEALARALAEAAPPQAAAALDAYRAALASLEQGTSAVAGAAITARAHRACACHRHGLKG